MPEMMMMAQKTHKQPSGPRNGEKGSQSVFFPHQKLSNDVKPARIIKISVREIRKGSLRARGSFDLIASSGK
jgi:hypothetical protein